MLKFTMMFPYIIYLILQTLVFIKFYKTPEGHKAVYVSWYASIIDILAIVSGLFICYLGYYFFNFENSDFPKVFFLLLFLSGSWQFSIHAAKMYLRKFF
jgi:hypothetical protein